MELFGNFKNWEKRFLEKILHQIKKVKKTDPPQNHPKTWQNQVILTISKGVMDFFCKLQSFKEISPRSHTWKMLKAPEWSLGGRGPPRSIHGIQRAGANRVIPTLFLFSKIKFFYWFFCFTKNKTKVTTDIFSLY